MKIAIIGPGGYIGTNFIKRLSAEGIEAIGFSSAGPAGIDPVSGILSDEFKVPSGTDAVVYLAQSPHYRKVPEFAWHLLSVNVTSAVRAAEAARKAGVRKFIYASTGNVYGAGFGPLSESSPLRRDNWYSLSKVQAEEALALFRNDMEVTSARIFGVYGPGQKDKLMPLLMGRIMDGEPVMIDLNPNSAGDLGGLKVSMCFIDDLVEMLLALCTKKGMPPAINLAGERPVSVKEAALGLAKALGKEARFNLTGRARPFDLVADVTLLKKTLSPRFTPLEEGIKKTAEGHAEGI